MKDEVIISLANAIEANAIALQKLIDAIPHEVRAVVAQEVVKPTPPKKTEQAPVMQVQPVVEKAPVEPQPVEVIEPAPLVAPASTPVVEASAAPTATDCPIKNGKDLTNYLMDAYKAMPQQAAALEKVLHDLGYRAVNEVKAESYAAIYAGVEALKS